jgi:hypothetical protein
VGAEDDRLAESRAGVPWKRWGPYLAERQWATVREDYSTNGDAWSSFPHDHARSRAYRWGEDGIAGFSDDHQQLCLALALWNEEDPILKERLFGLTNTEGNHGEDVKEYYFFLDATPTHSYCKMLYKYPHAAFPYEQLVTENRSRTRFDFEYELLDTGIFDEDRYFDVFVEYAKASPDDVLMVVTAHNRGPDAAPLHLLPTLWFRNTWAGDASVARPSITAGQNGHAVRAAHSLLGDLEMHADGDGQWLFTDNETNTERLWDTPNAGPWVKDAFDRFVVHGEAGAVNPEGHGTKATFHTERLVQPGQSTTIRLRLRRPGSGAPFGAAFDETMAARRAEADGFYGQICPPGLTDDECSVMRQALAGMIWSKQYYSFDVSRWLVDHGVRPLSEATEGVRNQDWFHMFNDDIISMPDTWEYPWYAAWDLAFHTLSLDMVDPDFARNQLQLLLTNLYQHPNGQLPAYEWAFGDVNPPVHAWATLFAFASDKNRDESDLAFLRSAFSKLLINFTWWVNRKDPSGRNVFEGGFLGLDNIGVFDRSRPLPTGGRLEQADATAWMAFYSQNMLEIALELAAFDEGFEDLALKFVEHFFWIASSVDRLGGTGGSLWDDEDGFFYDVVRLPDGTGTRLKVRSLVGLLPLCATTVISREVLERFPQLTERVRSFLARQPELASRIAPPNKPGVQGRVLLALVDETKLRRVLARMLDEDHFLSPHGIRSLSRSHLDDPYVFEVHGEEFRVQYEPAESTTGMFGGNSNWRGPVWFPTNILLVRALLQFHMYYGDEFTVECPTGSGVQMTLFEVAREISRRLSSIFLRDADGRRPVYGGSEKFQTDPHWRDHVLFYEYFHGDNGAGLGASHQTGWTGLVARLMQLFAQLDSATILEGPLRPTAIVHRGANGTA